MFLDSDGVIIEDRDHICEPSGVFHMYRRREHRNQISFEDFFLPFGGKLSGDNRLTKLAELIPWDELEDGIQLSSAKVWELQQSPFVWR